LNRNALRAQPGASWYRVKNRAGDGGEAAEVAIYDEIGGWGVTAQAFIAELKSITADRINLRLSSPGGEIFDGIAVYNALRSHNAYVTTYVDSLAASIASVIALAGDRVVMQPHSQLMIHDGSGLCIGNAADMREMADLLDRQSDNIAGIYADRAGGTVGQWRKRMQAETWYSDREAVAAGLADQVAKSERQAEPDDAPMAARFDLSGYRHAGRDHAPAPLIDGVEPRRAPTSPEPEVPNEPAPVAKQAKAPAFAFDPADFRARIAAAAGEAHDIVATAETEPVVEDSDETHTCAECGEVLEDIDAEHTCPDDEPAAVLAETIAAIAAEAPAVVAGNDEPLPEPPPPPPPPPPDEPPSLSAWWKDMAEVFVAGISNEANQSPAPSRGEQAPTPEDGADAVDGWAVHKAIKEAIR
jgi:ATP-dependent protease ClpP protease subunit